MNPAYAVPAAFGLAMVPHFAKQSILLGAQDGVKLNAKQAGRESVDDFQGKIPSEKLDLARRMGACHQNALEGLAMFASGVAFAVAARSPIDEISRHCAIYIGARVSYLIFYALPPIAGGMPRTLSWMTSSVACILLWVGGARYTS